MIASAKANNEDFTESLMHSVTLYGKEHAGEKAVGAFNKYVLGHSLGPLKLNR